MNVPLLTFAEAKERSLFLSLKLFIAFIKWFLIGSWIDLVAIVCLGYKDNYLILNYKEVVDNAAEVINIDLSDQAKSYSDIKEFLKVE